MKKLFIAASVLLVSVLSAEAQDFRTGYFLGGYQYAYRMNPAFPSEHNFFSVGLGQFGADVQSDFGFSDFIKKDEASGQYLLFLNDKVSSADFLSGFKQDELNKFELTSNVNLLSKGTWNKEKRSFSTFDISIKTTTRMDLPYDLFKFLKEGTSVVSNFDFSGTGVSSRNYLELAYGTTRNFNNVFSFGIRLKGLVGLANASMKMDKLNVTMTPTLWTVDSKGTLSGSVPFAELGTTTQGGKEYYDYSAVSITPGKITKNLGLGGAADIGISINLVPWITISAALLDFGYVNWMDEIYGVSNAVSAFTPSAEAGADQVDQFISAMKDIYKFEPQEVTAKTLGGAWEQMPYRVNGGVEIRVPFYQRLSVGALYTMYNGDFSFNKDELLLSANWTPLNFLSASVSSRLGDQFKVFGAAVNLHPSLFNLFAGIDVVPTKLINVSSLLGDKIPDAVKPYCLMPADDLNLNAYVGLSFALGKRQVDYRKMNKAILKEQKEKADAKAAEKKEKEEQKAKEQQLKEYEKAEKEAAKQAEKDAKEAEKQAKIAEKEAAKQAAEDAKAAKKLKR